MAWPCKLQGMLGKGETGLMWLVHPSRHYQYDKKKLHWVMTQAERRDWFYCNSQSRLQKKVQTNKLLDSVMIIYVTENWFKCSNVWNFPSVPISHICFSTVTINTRHNIGDIKQETPALSSLLFLSFLPSSILFRCVFLTCQHNGGKIVLLR